MTEEVDLPVPVEKIKTEKVTPPNSPGHVGISSNRLFGDPNPEDEKKEIGPLKSSDDFLKELFEVLNAAPPSPTSGSKKKHKKHKKKSKKKKKDSKSDLSDISDDSENDDGKTKEKKKKDKVKVKKEKEDVDHTRVSRKVKKEKRSRSRERSPSDRKISHKSDRETRSTKDHEPKEKEVDRSDRRDKSSKIVIRDLKHSRVIAEAESAKKSSKDTQRKRRASSSLSLSDEETYEKEREERERHSKQEGRSGRLNSPDRSRDSFRKSYRESHRSRQSEPRSEKDMRERIDKKKLLEIARKNAMTMIKNGQLPGAALKQLEKARYGGKSIDELTSFCKKLSNDEVPTDLSSVSSGDSDHDREGNSKAFNHPFVLKDRGPIVMNIRNAVPLPTRSVDQTNAILQAFPVSSGQQHRQSEMEWVPVEPTKEKALETATVKPPAKKPDAITTVAVIPQKVPTVAPVVPPVVPQQPLCPQMNHSPAFVTYPPPKTFNPSHLQPLAPPPLPPSMLSDTVFPKAPQSVASNVDVSTIISQRLNAMRKLQENPNDNAAMALMENTQKDMSSWAASKFTPGKFLGSTGANILSAKQLASGGNQAWAKRDAFTKSAPLSGGMGMNLLQKMGWKPGEALGKEKTGSLEPLLLEVKLDRKGLIAEEEGPKAKRKPMGGGGGSRNMHMSQQFIESKHPVSLLGELVAKRKWGAPFYELVHESGPHHHKSFVYQVVLNNLAYTPAVPCTTKKEAKKLAAQVCLEQLGILPKQGAGGTTGPPMTPIAEGLPPMMPPGGPPPMVNQGGPPL